MERTRYTMSVCMSANLRMYRHVASPTWLPQPMGSPRPLVSLQTVGLSQPIGGCRISWGRRSLKGRRSPAAARGVAAAYGAATSHGVDAAGPRNPRVRRSLWGVPSYEPRQRSRRSS